MAKKKEKSTEEKVTEKDWVIFEKEAAAYLAETFGNYAEFKARGGSNPTESDISVRTNSGKNFTIEVKMPSAQCGQFVLFPNETSRTFDFSTENRTDRSLAEPIISFMDDSFETFCEPTITGIAIEMPNGSEVFSEWVIRYYCGKDSRYFITRDDSTNNFVIFPTEDFLKHFTISATYRIKGSGSSDVAKVRFAKLREYIKAQAHKFGAIKDDDFSEVKRKLFVKAAPGLHEKRFVLDDRSIMFSKRGLRYELRLLSKTANPNVIFSIKKIENISGLSDDAFIQALTESPQ